MSLKERAKIMANTAEATLVDIRNYFGYTDMKLFRQDWSSLTDQDKADLKAGIGKGGTGPMTY